MKIKVTKVISIGGKSSETVAEAEYPDPKKGWGDYPEDMDRRVSNLAVDRARELFNSMESRRLGIGVPVKKVEGESFERMYSLHPDDEAFTDWVNNGVSSDFKSIASIKALNAAWRAALKYARNQK